MSVTIRDLAQHLRLSITTVSRALDGYADVAESTRQRVIRTAAEMGYEPSYAARHLRRKRSDALGYILPTSSPRFSDPFYTAFLTGLCDEAAVWQMDLMVTSVAPDSELERKLYRRWAQSRRVDGMVLNRVRNQDWRIDYLRENQMPFVSLGRSPSAPDAPGVVVDERAGMQALVTYLAGKGHQRIGYIRPPSGLVIDTERTAGYQDGLAQAGLGYEDRLVRTGDLSEECGYQAAQELLSLGAAPTAIIGGNDVTALGVLRAVWEKGLRPGRDIAVAGYDGIKEGEYATPPLTTLAQPTYEIACMLVRLLVRLVRGEALVESSITLQPRLVVRESSG